MLRGDTWQKVQANAISQMLPIKVGWIVNKRHPMLPRVARKCVAADVQEGANDLGLGIKAGDPTRSGVA